MGGGITLSPSTDYEAEQQSNTITVKGVVVDAQDEPIIGATVQVRGVSGKGAATDLDGRFSISGVSIGSVLEVSFVGMLTQEVRVENASPLRIVLREDSEVLEEVVVTAFGTGQKKASMVGSVQTIRPDELKVPTANLSASFAGRLAGVIAVQRSGQPGADGANFWIRGISSVNATNPLIILDGVAVSAGDLNAIDPEVIEGFSILKDATATALYGSRGANGVVIVTTKSGENLSRPIINVRVEGNVSSPTKMPEFVDGVEYMELFNEAIANHSTGDAPYSREKIDGTRLGLAPHIFPNVMWYDELFKDSAFNQKANFNIRGGGQKLHYFMSVTADHQTGMLKPIAKKYNSFDNSLQYFRYAFQNNIDVKFTDTSKISLKLNAQISTNKGPSTSIADLFSQVINSNPVDFPIQFPDDEAYPYPLWGSSKPGPALIPNPYANAVAGYWENFSSTVIANLQFDQDLSMITEGLRFTAQASFKNWSSTSSTRARNNNYFNLRSYTLDPATGVYDYETNRLNDEQNTTLGTRGNNGGDRRLYMHAMLLWDREFGDHSVGAMFNYNQEETAQNIQGTNLLHNLPRRKQGIAGRFTYSFMNRYIAEANFGYNGSENFAAGKRFGFFPSAALGYIVSEEKFWEPIKPYVQLFKLRGSYGLVGNDAIGGDRFVYLEDIELTNGSGYTTGQGQNYSLNGPKYKRFKNEEITWEVGRKLNVGLDIQFLKDFRLNVDYFREYRTNVFQQRGAVPTYMGTADTKIYGNLAEISNWGIDGSIEYNKQFNKDLWISSRGTFTFARNRVEKWDEPLFMEYPQLLQVGRSLNTHVGYIAERLFIDDADVAAHPEQDFREKPRGGDIKYKDLPNKDGEYNGKIDSNDRMPIGYPTIPEIVYGFGVNAGYKGFDLGVFFQGVANTSMMLSGFHPFGTQYNRNALKFIAEDRWTPTNQNIYARYPRLTKIDHQNNTVGSTYWLRDGAFLKLKNAEIGYTYKNMRFYVSGQNLLTFSKFKLWDPEMGGGNGLKYPTQRTFNVGIQVTFK